MTPTPTQDILSGIVKNDNTEGATLSPFSGATISDSNDASDAVTAFILDDNIVAGALDAGALPGGSYVTTSDGSLIMLSGSAASVQANLRALQFKPGEQNAGSVQTAHLTIVLTNTADSTNFSRTITNASVQSTGINVAVVGLPAAATVPDTASVALLPNATVISADSDAVTVHVSMSDGTLGRFDIGNGPGTGALVTQNSDGSVTFSGSTAAVTADLQALGFKPASGAAGNTGHENFAVFSTDTVNGTTATATIALNINGTAPAVTVSGVVGSSSVEGGSDVALFANLSLTNLSAGDLTATVINDAAANGSFDLAAMPYGAADGVTETLGADGATLTILGSTEDVQADLQALRLHTVNPASNTAVSNVTLTLTTTTNQTANTAEQLSITPSGSAPVLAGNATVETRMDSVALYPDVSVSGPLTTIDATITLSDPSVANFDQAAFIQAEQGHAAITYKFSNDGSGLDIVGDAAAVTSALKQVQLKTSTPATAVQSSESATLTLSAYAGTTTSSTTILVDGPALVADAVTGILSMAAANGGVSFNPFAQATITDANVGDTVTAVVTSTDADQFDMSGLAAGSYSRSSDGLTATITGSAATVENDLHALALLPAVPASNAAHDTTLTIALSNAAGTSRVAGNTITEQVAVSAPPTYWSDTGADNTSHIFSVFSDPARTATIDLTTNPNQGIVVFGGNSALDLTTGHAVIVLDGQNQNGAVSIHSLGDNAVWVGAAPVDYAAGGESCFILGDKDSISSTVTMHGGIATDVNEFDVWGNASETQTITTDGISRDIIFGGHANLAYTGRNAIVVLNGASGTGTATIHSDGGNTVWAGTASLDFSEGAGNDTILLTGTASTMIHGSGVAEAGTTSVLAIGNTGLFTYDGGAKTAELQLGGGTNSVHGGTAQETISMAGTGSLLVSDDRTTSGAQSIVIDQGFAGSMRFLGGANQASLHLGGGNAIVTAGTDTTIAGGKGTATIDLSAAVRAVVNLDGSMAGDIDVMGFNPTQGSAALTHVAASSVSSGNLVVTFDDGAHATFHGYVDANHTGVTFG